MKEQTVCFTGHRVIPEEQMDEIGKKLRQAIMDQIEKGYCYFGTGGALGFDTMAARIVLSLKKVYPQIRLILVLPCLSQSKNWSVYDRRVYEKIKQLADKVVYISLAYTPDCMHRRNRHLVDHSSVCICYLTKPTGGTAYTFDYAKKQGLSIICI